MPDPKPERMSEERLRFFIDLTDKDSVFQELLAEARRAREAEERLAKIPYAAQATAEHAPPAGQNPLDPGPGRT